MSIYRITLLLRFEIFEGSFLKVIWDERVDGLEKSALNWVTCKAIKLINSESADFQVVSNNVLVIAHVVVRH